MDEDLPEPSKKCAKVDSYGCVNWQPSKLPEGETLESLYEKQRELLNIYSQEGQRGADQKRVNDLMALLYMQQRHNINATPSPSMSDLQKEWPFLFIKKFLLQHFCTLTGIELEPRLRESLASKGKRLLHYFKSQLLKWKKEVKTVLYSIENQMEDVDPGLAAIILMIAYFKEKEDAFFLLADETSTQADIEAQISLPSTPRLIMLDSNTTEMFLGSKDIGIIGSPRLPWRHCDTESITMQRVLSQHVNDTCACVFNVSSTTSMPQWQHATADGIRKR
ncbi:hypothetical protein M9458_054609 [Cirrhinus mrigala]|uniref:Uncharacterized protein n=2 Tax=Cirrhinus mrigala TaxID=683832 RepID=A0ABD0MMC2_CIRMR